MVRLKGLWLRFGWPGELAATARSRVILNTVWSSGWIARQVPSAWTSDGASQRTLATIRMAGRIGSNCQVPCDLEYCLVLGLDCTASAKCLDIGWCVSKDSGYDSDGRENWQQLPGPV